MCDLTAVGQILYNVRHMNLKMILLHVSVLLACSVGAVQFDAAEPIWTTAEKDEINSSVAFTTHFDWDGKAPLKCGIAEEMFQNPFHTPSSTEKWRERRDLNPQHPP